MAVSNDGVDDRLVTELAGIAAGSGCELVHVELKGGILRLVLDREPGGVSLEDCSHVSRQASALLDVVDFGPARYTLEVTSPGLDRPLYRAEDFARFTGRLARITIQPPGGKKRTVVARLAGFDAAGGGQVTVTDEKGEPQVISLAQVTKARLEIEL
ncbi:MAG TPA: ribosome maturation factor RimP [Thermoanaerobaculia bacterium]|jgi:ribosome maturation factor RimP|nr:ribosome maturation factor RimP [Thermoanaerobaculia bacterium]